MRITPAIVCARQGTPCVGMTSTANGRRAEAAAASFLERKGCRVIVCNWRTRWCEIDIVAVRGDTIYFCEVKYRSHHKQGSGLDYITPKKLRQMQFAAELWMAVQDWRGNSQLSAIEVSGPDFTVSSAVLC